MLLRAWIFVVAVAAITGAAQAAQFALGPNGVSHAPINLLSVYNMMRNAWSSVTGTGDSSVKVATPSVAENRRAGGGDNVQYNSDLQYLKSRIQAASQAAALQKQAPGPFRIRGEKIRTKKGDTEAPLTRAILLPKKKLKKIKFGKWPVVYGVLNGLLLAAAIHLAVPYFTDGETIIEAYKHKDDHGNHGGYSGYPSQPNHHPHGGGYYSPHHMTPVTIPVPAYPMDMHPPPPYGGSPHMLHQISPMYNSHMMVLRDQQERHKYDTKEHHTSGEEFKKEKRHRKRTPSRKKNSNEFEDVPLNELHYYNPTVFTSNEPSSYGCMEKMVCMNPSRSSRALAMSNIGKARAIASEEDGPSWESMIKRLDSAAKIGKRSGAVSCEQYFCPPQLPNIHKPQVGDHYVPPPENLSFGDIQDQSQFDPSYLEAIRTLELQSDPFGSVENFKLKSRKPTITKGTPIHQNVFLKDFGSKESVQFLKSGEEASNTLHRRLIPTAQLVQAPKFQELSDETNNSKIRTSQYAQVSVQSTASESYEDDARLDTTDLLRLTSQQINENAKEALKEGTTSLRLDDTVNF